MKRSPPRRLPRRPAAQTGPRPDATLAPAEPPQASEADNPDHPDPPEREGGTDLQRALEHPRASEQASAATPGAAAFLDSGTDDRP